MTKIIYMAPQSSAGTKPIVDLIGRRLSTATVLFHTAVADRMGVSVTDAKCRSLLLSSRADDGG